MIVNAEDQVLGRLCSRVSKRLMDGEEISVVNCGRAIITGNPDETLKKYLEKKEIGDPEHGPFHEQRVEGVLRRTVRGMLPHKKPKGREALQRLETYSGNPFDEEGEQIAKSKGDIRTNYITLEKLSKKLRSGE